MKLRDVWDQITGWKSDMDILVSCERAVRATLSYMQKEYVITEMNRVNPRNTAFEACRKLGIVHTRHEARRRWDE